MLKEAKHEKSCELAGGHSGRNADLGRFSRYRSLPQQGGRGPLGPKGAPGHGRMGAAGCRRGRAPDGRP
eukprot:1605981-Lingulodinium_polyedra.AAC.1